MSPNSANSDGGQSGEEESRQQREPSAAEKAVMVVSIAFTVSLFAFAGWQMAMAPSDGAEPEVSVVGMEPMEDGSVAVTVRLRNPRNVGLISATVSSNCTSPPTELEFSYIPADSDRTGTLVCPPGTRTSSVSVVSWVSR